MKKNKIIVVVLLCALLLVGGGTLAYFNSRHTNVTTLTTKVYSTQATQEYTSPENFLPGTLVNMNTKVENTGKVTVAVRAKIEESWTSHNNASLALYQTKSNKYYRTILFNTNSSQECLTTSCATDITSINSDWTYSNGYYYYKSFLNSNEETTSLIDSLLFNSYIENDMSCSTDALTGDNVCSSTGNGYDNATYNLRLTFETVQSDVYRTYWNTNVNITDLQIILPLGRTKNNLQFGDEICIKGTTRECFNFIRYDGNDVVMLAKYNLNVGSNPAPGAQGVQNSEALGYFYDEDTDEGGDYGTVSFGYAYWLDNQYGGSVSDWPLKSKYGSDYPADVYDPDYDSETGNNYSIAYYVKAYQSILEGYGAVIKDSRLLTYSEASSQPIGCDIYGDCPANSFINRTSFWLGTAANFYGIMGYNYGGHHNILDGLDSSILGVRPIIIIDKANM